MTAKVPPKPPASAVARLIRKQREAVRMTVAQLAQRIEASRNTITNYEAGKTEPTASDLVRIATALGCGIQELLQPESAAAPPRFAFRAHAALKKNPSVLVTARRFFRAYAEIEEITEARLPDRWRPFIRDTDAPIKERDIEEVADTLRQKCGLHDTGPENIASVLEGLGVRCLFFKSASRGLDGMSAIQGDMVFTMLNDEGSTVERIIFSGAHELGHLVLHSHLFTAEEDEGHVSDVVEKEANTFAGCFLVPGNELTRIWREHRLHRLPLFHALLLLKRVFHVSFRCLFYRARELDLTTLEYRTFVSETKAYLGIAGAATVADLEPERLPRDCLYRTTRFESLVRSAFLRDLIGVSKVAEMLQIADEDAQEVTAEWLRPKDVLVEDSPV